MSEPELCLECGAFMEGDTCPKCGYKKISPPPQRAFNYEDSAPFKLRIMKERTRPTTLNEVKQILGTTIKHDDANKLIISLTMLLNYTEEDQQNVSFNAPSSTGKSYIALEVAKFFPEEDVDIHSYTSPTAFFHELGKLTYKDGQPLQERRQYVKEKMDGWVNDNPAPYVEKGKRSPERAEWKEKYTNELRDAKAEWDAIDKIYVVDLEKRILIFVDQPHDRLLQLLRALLSHDRKMLPVKITDKTREGGHRTKNIMVKGFPSVFFASAAFSMDPQEQTRLWLLSPEMSTDKIKDSLKLQAKSRGNRDQFNTALSRDEGREFLRQRVQAIKEQEIRQIIVRDEDQDALLSWFLEGRGNPSPRAQRDFPRVIDLVKAHALLNLFQRERTPDGHSIYATKDDMAAVKTLVASVIKANELGLPPYIHKFWLEKLQPSLDEYGITREEFSKLYKEFYHERLGERARKKTIDLLGEAGLVYEAPDPEDKRSKKIYALAGGGEKKLYNGEVPPMPNEEALIEDLAAFFTDRDQANIQLIHAHVKNKGHHLTQDDLYAFTKGHPELFEVDGWGTVTVKEGV